MAILTLNAGSSSIKFALFGGAEGGERLLHGSLSRIGASGATLKCLAADGSVLSDKAISAVTAADAGAQLITWLKAQFAKPGLAENGKPVAIGHRIVHGGMRSLEHQRITTLLLAEMDKAVPLDPAHLPVELGLIRQCRQQFAQLPQFACFDTVFHARLPRVTTMLPLPRRYFDAGVRKYGFHGLSYEFLMAELRRVGDAGEAKGRVLMAHLGAGASLAAVADGAPIDTTMAFTPTSGLMMATRPGDLDAGVMVYLARGGGIDAGGLDAAALERLINSQCGLMGVSQTSGDIRDLLAQRKTDERAAEAVAMFCGSVVRHIGAMAAVMGGIDTLIFSGGIGENSPEIRAEICKTLAFLGVTIDAQRNDEGCGVISPGEQSTAVAGGRSVAGGGSVAGVVVRIVRTDEEAMIARHVGRLMAESGGGEGGA